MFIVLLYLYPIVILFQGEEYKLFWPEQSEFIRMAARFGAKIIPFGAVGEDDIFQVICRLYLSDFVNYLILDYMYTTYLIRIVFSFWVVNQNLKNRVAWMLISCFFLKVLSWNCEVFYDDESYFHQVNFFVSSTSIS